MMLSDVCLSVAYIGPKSRTERPRKTKIGTEVAHVTHDSDTTFKVKRWSRSPGHFAHRRAGASGGCSGGVGTCWPWETAATLRLLGGARRFGAHGGKRGAGHIVVAARLQFVYLYAVDSRRFP